MIVSLTSHIHQQPTLSSRPRKMVTSGMSAALVLSSRKLTHSIWKSNASKKIGPISTKERQSIEYRQKLVEKWSTSKDVRSVAERRFVPASIHNTTKLKRDMIEAQKVKEDRRRSHTRAGKEKPKAERKSTFLFACVLQVLADDLQRLSSRSRSRW
jgi:DNA replication protein DnaC